MIKAKSNHWIQTKFSVSISHLGQTTGQIQIKDVYKIDETSRTIHLEDYGHWDPKKGMAIFQQNMMKRRSNFHGHNFK